MILQASGTFIFTGMAVIDKGESLLGNVTNLRTAPGSLADSCLTGHHIRYIAAFAGNILIQPVTYFIRLFYK